MSSRVIFVLSTDKVREANGCVLIHCLAGISRSPTVAIAYLMRVLGMTSDDAYRYDCLQLNRKFSSDIAYW